MNVCFFGGYRPEYPRNAILRRGLALAGADVLECRVRPSHKFWLRYPLLLGRYAFSLKKTGLGAAQGGGFLFVPEFCQKDVPIAGVISRLTSRPVIFDPLASRYETKILDRGIWPEKSTAARWNAAIDRRAFRRADLILADTAAHKAYYSEENGIPGEKIEVLPVGFDDRVWNEASSGNAPSAVFVVMFFGSFLPLHGTDVILEAARLVATRDPLVEFRIIGSGQTFPAASKVAESAGLCNVRFEGWLPYRELARRVAAEANLCLGIFGKSGKARRVVPHKVFQAMAAGKPVLTLRTPAAEEFFRHGDHIYFCDGPDPARLAGAILDLKNDAGLRGGIARRGCALVREKFSPLALGKMLMDHLDQRFGRENRRGTA